ncbi:MAG TPA: pyridoxal-phosphate dependent enzyme, partial [Thermoproteota archaeon]|nr:pyridoxal-phosphate dependent enzyme [Thermoproteota archaeon]
MARMSQIVHQTKVVLGEEEIPTSWYSILNDLPRKLPPVIDPATKGPGPGVVPRLFPRAILEQEFTQERWVGIPEEVRDVYRLWRPTPLYRALRLERALKTPAKIYYKYEGVSPAGSHKVNTAVAQAYYNMKEGTSRMATETGAGQWGSALSFGCNVFGIGCTVYMVRASYDQKPYRRTMMELWGGEVYPSPSERTEAGRKLLKENPEHPGSLGVAISEAVEDTL